MKKQKQLGIVYETAEGNIHIALDFYSPEQYFIGRVRRLKNRGCNILYSNDELSAQESAILFNEKIKARSNRAYFDESRLNSLLQRLEQPRMEAA